MSRGACRKLLFPGLPLVGLASLPIGVSIAAGCAAACRCNERCARLRRQSFRPKDDRVRGAGGQRREPRNRGQPAGNPSKGAGCGSGNEKQSPRPDRRPPAAGHVLLGRVAGVRAGRFGKRSDADHLSRGEGRLRNPQRRGWADLCLAALQERHFRLRPSAGQGGESQVLRAVCQWPAADSRPLSQR